MVTRAVLRRRLTIRGRTVDLYLLIDSGSATAVHGVPVTVIPTGTLNLPTTCYPASALSDKLSASQLPNVTLAECGTY